MSTKQVTQAPAAANLTAAVATNQVFALATNPNLAAILSGLGTKRMGARKFLVRISGVVTTVGAATTFAPFLAVGSSPLIANDTIIAQPAGATVNTTSAPWWLEAQLIFDSISGKLQGVYTSMVNNTFTAPATLSTVVTGLNDVAEPPFQMVTGGMFSAGASGNVVTLGEFVLEL